MVYFITLGLHDEAGDVDRHEAVVFSAQLKGNFVVDCQPEAFDVDWPDKEKRLVASKLDVT